MNGADDRLGMSLAVLSFLSGAERARLRTIGDVLKVPDDVLFACVDGLERVPQRRLRYCQLVKPVCWKISLIWKQLSTSWAVRL